MANLEVTAKEFFDKVKKDEPPTKEEFVNAIRAAHKQRATICYIIWKKLQKEYPEIDATKFMSEAHEEFGDYYGKKWPELKNCKDAILTQSSKSGYLAFDQTLVAFDEDFAQKDFGYCPHMAALTDLGASAEEKKVFCQEILSSGDYANLYSHPGVELVWTKQIGNGDDHCEYCVKKETK